MVENSFALSEAVSVLVFQISQVLVRCDKLFQLGYLLPQTLVLFLQLLELGDILACSGLFSYLGE